MSQIAYLDDIIRAFGLFSFNYLNCIAMEKVFIVYYDNGFSYDDNEVVVFKVYSSRDKADAFVKERMDAINSTPKEELYFVPKFFVAEYDVEQ